MTPRLLLIVLVATLLLPLRAATTPRCLLFDAERSGGYSLYLGPGAPPSVQFAAQEIRRIVQAAGGPELPLVTEPGPGPLICLGESPLARAAGVTADGLPDDGFRIRTVGESGNVFIVGKDNPEDKYAWRGWSSRGTMFGAFDFLERVIGVRWLFPGALGEEIPALAAVTIPELQVESKPSFPIRYLVDIQERRPEADPNRRDTHLWLLHQKVPPYLEGRKLEHGHAWDDYVSEAQLAEHPEWLAKDEQGRPRSFARHAAVKLCTSQPAMVEAFAAGVVKRLDEHPGWRTASISPSDGGDFCLCEACQKLTETDPHGRRSVTPLILTFYNEVAKLVARRHPDRLLGGYVYYNYMYPPKRPIAMEPNVWLVWAPLNYYGRGLQKPVYRDEYPQVVRDWVAVTRNFTIHNYSTWLRAFNGAPLPPALDILKLELPTAARAGALSADMVGLGAWGFGAPSNYILAKQMWDAETDVEAVFDEWLRLAYGPAAAPMRELTMLLEGRMRDWKERESPVYRGMMYEVNYELIDAVFRPVMADIERLYRAAMAAASTERQRQRLAMYGENLVMLHHNMRQAGMELPSPETSIFYRSDEDYQRFLDETEFSIAVYRNYDRRYTGPIWKGEWSGD